MKGCSWSSDYTPAVADTAMRLGWRPLPQLFLHASYFVGHGLVAVNTGAEFDGSGDARRTQEMDSLMAQLDRSHNRIPVALDVGAVGMQLRL